MYWKLTKGSKCLRKVTERPKGFRLFLKESRNATRKPSPTFLGGQGTTLEVADRLGWILSPIGTPSLLFSQGGGGVPKGLLFLGQLGLGGYPLYKGGDVPKGSESQAAWITHPIRRTTP